MYRWMDICTDGLTDRLTYIQIDGQTDWHYWYISWSYYTICPENMNEFMFLVKYTWILYENTHIQIPVKIPFLKEKPLKLKPINIHTFTVTMKCSMHIWSLLPLDQYFTPSLSKLSFYHLIVYYYWFSLRLQCCLMLLVVFSTVLFNMIRRKEWQLT